MKNINQLNMFGSKNILNNKQEEIGLIKTSIGYSFKLIFDNDKYKFNIINKKISSISREESMYTFITPGQKNIYKKYEI